uniref:TLC domain-containing protein n=1 Tax=Steinernema glaseri TaxID=37863 RepID=A0A1I8AM61_9BILA
METMKSDANALMAYYSGPNEKGAILYGPHSGAELRMPPWSRLEQPGVILTITAYFLLFQMFGALVRTHTWLNHTGFRKYRLQNLTVCIVHSVITGCWAVSSLLLLRDEMLHHVIHYVSPIIVHLPMISIAYFAYDITDMLRHEISRWTIELFMHHAAAIFVLISAVLPEKFLLYAHWALIMEFNSIFLHLRSIMQLSGEAERLPGCYRLVKSLNIATLITCRFCVQFWQLMWAFNNYRLMHPFYVCIAGFGSLFFLASNTILFSRILTTDGWLCDCAIGGAASGRYEVDVENCRKDESFSDSQEDGIVMLVGDNKDI